MQCGYMVHTFHGAVTGKLYQGDIQLYEKKYLHDRKYSSFTAFIDRSWHEEQFNAALADCVSPLLADLELFNKLKLLA